MIKNFETYINEDYFSKLASRKDNSTTRKENIIRTNIKDIVPVNIFADSGRLWASTTLEVDGSRLLTYKEAQEIVNSKEIQQLGWRIPSDDEWSQDFNGIRPYLPSDDELEDGCERMWEITYMDEDNISDTICVPLDSEFINYEVAYIWTTSEPNVKVRQYVIELSDNEIGDNKRLATFLKSDTAQLLLVKDK